MSVVGSEHVVHDPWDLLCRAASSRRLVPGDVIVVLQGRATCDMVLLRGSCLVEESMLSGEVCTHIQFTPSKAQANGAIGYCIVCNRWPRD